MNNRMKDIALSCFVNAGYHETKCFLTSQIDCKTYLFKLK